MSSSSPPAGTAIAIGLGSREARWGVLDCHCLALSQLENDAVLRGKFYPSWCGGSQHAENCPPSGLLFPSVGSGERGSFLLCRSRKLNVPSSRPVDFPHWSCQP